MPDASWKQIIPMRRLFIFVQRRFRFSRPVGRVGFKVKEPVKDIKVLQDYHSPLLDLPAELLLVIANFLEREFRILLSLSCRRLRVLLNSCLDLSIYDIDGKLRFLRYLELDYPEYLTCRSCGFTFKMASEAIMGLSLSACNASLAHGQIDIIRLVYARRSVYQGDA
jgi:hypothetical protein